LWFAAAVGVFIVFRDSTVPGLGVVNQRTAQLLAFPPFAIAVWRLRFAGERISRTAILLAVACAVMASAVTYLYPANLRRGFLVAPFAGDDLQTRSRIFREALNEQLNAHSKIRAASYFAPLEKDRSARSIFTRTPSLQGLVWGNNRWLSISFPIIPPAPLAGSIVQHLPDRYRELLLVTTVPVLGLSREPEEQTRHFIATLFSGILPLYSQESDPAERTILFENQWGFLRDAAVVEAFWSSKAHQAYPWFLIGNRAVERAFQGPRFEPHYILCARSAYREASSLLRAGDNPELRAAIYNNWGVTLLLGSLQLSEPALAREGRQHLRRAVLTKSEKDLFGVQRKAVAAARLNLLLMKAKSRKSERVRVKNNAGEKRAEKKKAGKKGSKKIRKNKAKV
jgi:hypothetical protein